MTVDPSSSNSIPTPARELRDQLAIAGKPEAVFCSGTHHSARRVQSVCICLQSHPPPPPARLTKEPRQPPEATPTGKNTPSISIRQGLWSCGLVFSEHRCHWDAHRVAVAVTAVYARSIAVERVV
eukprot:3546958-Rhodomonas_salina.2